MDKQPIFPNWMLKFALRLMQLRDGRYQIVLTIDGDSRDWTVIELGKVERDNGTSLTSQKK